MTMPAISSAMPKKNGTPAEPNARRRLAAESTLTNIRVQSPVAPAINSPMAIRHPPSSPLNTTTSPPILAAAADQCPSCPDEPQPEEERHAQENQVADGLGDTVP